MENSLFVLTVTEGFFVVCHAAWQASKWYEFSDAAMEVETWR